MRTAVLAEMLAELDADHALPALGLLSDRAKSGHADARRVIAELALQTDLFTAMPYPIRSVAYTRAKRRARRRRADAAPGRPEDQPNCGRVSQRE